MIRFDHVSFTYQGQNAGGLTDVSLEIARGECVLLCGPSGCGKTTLTRLINGLVPQFYAGTFSGRVTLDGADVTTQPMYALARVVGSVFQNPRTQFFNTDSDSEIAFGIENQGLPPALLAERVTDTCRALGLEHLRGRSLFAMSGGEKQKIAFASVYAMQPQVFLLDEPSSNLDMPAMATLHDHLRLLKAQGKTILIAEHRVNYLMDLVDRVVVLEDGQLRGTFTPQALAALPEAEREKMGLRALDLRQVLPPLAQPPARQQLLTLEDVGLRVAGRTILQGLSFSAGAGEIIAVCGANGTGKTTLSRALCGLHKDVDGRFLWLGEDVSYKARRRLSYLVMQDVNYELFAESVEKEAAFGIRDADPALVDTTLETLGLSPYRERHPNTLSGGQKQRLAVAASIVAGKPLLVFDEPTSGLDRDSMRQVAALLRGLAAEGRLIVVVTHDWELVCQACTRLLYLAEGRLAGDWPVTQEHLPDLRRVFEIEKGEKIL